MKTNNTTHHYEVNAIYEGANRKLYRFEVDEFGERWFVNVEDPTDVYTVNGFETIPCR